MKPYETFIEYSTLFSCENIESGHLVEFICHCIVIEQSVTVRWFFYMFYSQRQAWPPRWRQPSQFPACTAYSSPKVSGTISTAWLDQLGSSRYVTDCLYQQILLHNLIITKRTTKIFPISLGVCFLFIPWMWALLTIQFLLCIIIVIEKVLWLLQS